MPESQTDPQHCEEETQNMDSHFTIKAKQQSFLFLNKMVAKLERTPTV